jgi:hypothetical protein
VAQGMAQSMAQQVDINEEKRWNCTLTGLRYEEIQVRRLQCTNKK